MRTHEFKSRSSDRVYQVIENEGKVSCNCPGWIFKRAGKPRGCRHTAQIATSPMDVVFSQADAKITAEKAQAYFRKIHDKLVAQGRSDDEARRDAQNWVTGNFGRAA